MNMDAGICFSIFIMFSFNMVVYSEASALYCYGQELPWRDAMLRCIDAGGTPVGRDMYGNGLQTDGKTYWTSDFITKQNVNTAEQADFCDYRNYINHSGFGTENFRDCSHVLFYVCCIEGQTLRPDCLRNGTWTDANSCKQPVNNYNFSKANFPSGAYWTRNAIKLIQLQFSVNRTSSYQEQSIYLCGVFHQKGTFQYMSDCHQALPLHCSFVSGSALWPVPTHMRYCSYPSSMDKTSTKLLTSHLTTMLRPQLSFSTFQTTTWQSKQSIKTTSQRQEAQKATFQRAPITNIITESILKTSEQTNLNIKSTKDSYPRSTRSSRSTFNIFSKVNAISHLQELTTKEQQFLPQILNVYGRFSTATLKIRQQDTRTKDSYTSTTVTTSSFPTFNIFSKVNAISSLQEVTTKGQNVLTYIRSTTTHDVTHQDTRQYKAKQTDSKTWIMVGLGVGAVALVAATAVIILILCRRSFRRRQEEVHNTETHIEENSYEQLQNKHYANIQAMHCKDEHLYSSVKGHIEQHST